MEAKVSKDTNTQNKPTNEDLVLLNVMNEQFEELILRHDDYDGIKEVLETALQRICEDLNYESARNEMLQDSFRVLFEFNNFLRKLQKIEQNAKLEFK